MIKKQFFSSLLRIAFLGIALLGAIISLVGCPAAEHGTGKALSNVGSVFRSGEKKLWIDPASESASEQEKKKKAASETSTN